MDHQSLETSTQIATPVGISMSAETQTLYTPTRPMTRSPSPMRSESDSKRLCREPVREIEDEMDFIPLGESLLSLEEETHEPLSLDQLTRYRRMMTGPGLLEKIRLEGSRLTTMTESDPRGLVETRLRLLTLWRLLPNKEKATLKKLWDQMFWMMIAESLDALTLQQLLVSLPEFANEGGSPPGITLRQTLNSAAESIRNVGGFTSPSAERLLPTLGLHISKCFSDFLIPFDSPPSAVSAPRE